MSRLPTHWTTRDGRVLKISAMEDDHIAKAMGHMLRHPDAWKFVQYPMPRMNGEHAQEAAENEWLDAMMRPIEESPLYQALARERRRRERRYANIAAEGWPS